ncbi:Cyclin-dependent kinase inhibitor 3 [Vitis vinifera]|uniref:Cyclin-dependent kinase inhibitor n=1 Tax=Vitis vinifera TaxID=29760 RepID=A0A438C8E5_VITVI|nr:Cyclin-dependent kinase inhibitor 3 [Vitis vinifera]
MGKYMRKAKARCEVAVMEVSQPCLGVRTRAKTLALERLQKSRPRPSPPQSPPQQQASSSSYLQLRSRRLLKPPILVSNSKKHKQNLKEGDVENPNPKVKARASSRLRVGSVRSTRETTPCSLIRDPETIRTPGSTTKPASSSGINRRMDNSRQGHVPTTQEMDQFFQSAEEEQQRVFTDKYNFDPVNDKPLSGRFEWVKLNR